MRGQARNNWLRWVSRLSALVGLVVLAVGAYLSWNEYVANRAASQAKPRGAYSASSANPAPSTKTPGKDAFAAYTVADDAPRYLFIPKITVRAMVKPVGITDNNQLGAPRNVFDAGWYTGSVKPGQRGAMVVDGHVSSRETNGVFFGLKKLRQGDNVTIERGDGQQLTYRVVKSQTYDADKVDMATALAPINPEKPGLNLITCAGSVIKGTNEFSKRIVVFAEQI